MKHTGFLKSLDLEEDYKKRLIKKSAGQYYTPEPLIDDLVSSVFETLKSSSEQREIGVVDPFCGDGRLVLSLLDRARDKGFLSEKNWKASFWDYSKSAVNEATENFKDFSKNSKLDIRTNFLQGDSFRVGREKFGNFDLVITNPPWDILKPNRNELKQLTDRQRDKYNSFLREYDKLLASRFPASQPKRKFAGWGTNLSRVGLELSIKLLKQGGVCGIVMPMSVLNDQSSLPLRRWLLNFELESISYYPSEAKLFEGVDQDVVTMLVRNEPAKEVNADLRVFDDNLNLKNNGKLKLDDRKMEYLNYSIPANMGREAISLLMKWADFPKVSDLEGESTKLWMGRELDETGYKNYLRDHGHYLFLKGRMVERFGFLEEPNFFVDEEIVSIPDSADQYRVVWRDVSRKSQARRVQAVLIPPKIATGNSLNVAYFKTRNLDYLKAFAVLLNSLPFELQVRARLGTNHISKGIIREIRIPNFDKGNIEVLRDLYDQYVDMQTTHNCIKMEVEVAKLYKLDKVELSDMLSYFPKLDEKLKEKLIAGFEQ